MKSQAEIWFRIGIGLLALLLGWEICAAVQTPSQTNSAIPVGSTNEPSTAKIAGESGDNTNVLTFHLDRIEFLNYELPQGFPLYQYAASFIFIVLALAASTVLDQLARAYLLRWAQQSKTKFAEVVVTLLEGPIKVICFVILLHIGLRLFGWPTWIEDFLSKGLKIVVALSLTYMVTKFVELFMNRWKQRATIGTDKTFDEQLFPILKKTAKVFVVVVATLLTAHNLGIDITSLLASLSIGGLALGLAAQDTLANVFGAVSVLIDKPFKVGDRVQLEGIDGTVEAIGLRSTRVRSLNGHLITVPNKTIGGAVITNVTLRPSIKTEINIGVTYDTSLEKLKRAVEVINEVYNAHPMTADLIVSFNKFADCSLNILVVHWWNATDFKEYLAGMQGLNFQIKERFDREGIEMAFPTQTVYVKQGPQPALT